MKRLVESCERCKQYDFTQRKETLRSAEVPKRPWQRLTTDLFSCKGKEPVMTVDYYSNFWEIDQLPNTSATTVINNLNNHFARYGCLDTVIGDSGSQFSCQEFAHFSKLWEFQHRAINPGRLRQQSNNQTVLAEV